VFQATNGTITGSVFHVGAGAILELDGPTISRHASSNGFGVDVLSGGKFAMHSGTIHNHNSRGVSVRAGGIFEMLGGTIYANNTGTGQSAAIYVRGTATMRGGDVVGAQTTSQSPFGVDVYGTFTMYGGTIRDLRTSGVRVWGYFEMRGGTITNNRAPTGTTGSGGGVQISAGGFFEMINGQITNNSAGLGGGVSLQGWGGMRADFVMHGGTISGNRAYYQGGGVRGSINSHIVMHGGTISDNVGLNVRDEAVMGGGIDVHNNSTFRMYAGTIRDNTSSFGGGVSIGTDSEFTMNNGTISDNTAVVGPNQFGFGGGVYLDWDSAFTMNNGTISDNIAQRTGGGVSLHMSSEFIMNDGTVSGNNAESSGGGVFLSADSSLNISGGAITNNTAPRYGGGIFTANYNYSNPIPEGQNYYGNITINMSLTTFEGNTAGEGRNNPPLNHAYFPFGLLLNNHDINYINPIAPTFTIRFQPGTQGAFAEQIHANIEENEPTPDFVGIPTGNPGWTFSGWSPELATTVTADATYVAQWTTNISEYATVTFLPGANGRLVGGNATGAAVHTDLAVGVDSIPSAPETIPNAGWRFAGWAPTLSSGLVSGDLTFTATWELRTDITGTVNFFRAGTQVRLAPSITRTGMTMGVEWTELAIEIPGYRLVGEASQTVTLEATGNVINFIFIQYVPQQQEKQQTSPPPGPADPAGPSGAADPTGQAGSAGSTAPARQAGSQGTQTPPPPPSPLLAGDTDGDEVENLVVTPPIVAGTGGVQPEENGEIPLDMSGWESEGYYWFEDSAVPLVAGTPLFAPNGYSVWALVNLLLAILGAIFAVVITLRVFLYNKDRVGYNEHNYGNYDDDEDVDVRNVRFTWLLVANIMAIIGIVIFLITQNMRNPMVLVDMWTIAHAIIITGELIALYCVEKRRRDRDDGEFIGERSRA